jgi:membrane protease YdiL (CAAX protease family)
VAKSRTDAAGWSAAAAGAASHGGYHEWSRDPAVGLFAVVPLWLLYEALRLCLTPADRNGAEVLLLREVDRLGGHGLLVLRLALGVLMARAAVSLVRRRIPWIRVAAVLALEGAVYGLLLGPLAGALTSSAARLLEAVPRDANLIANLVGSLGAGIFEELLFRLGLMSALVWFGVRVTRSSRVPKWTIGVFAVLVSALVFAWFHHLCGEPYERTRFVFRTMAGVLLGFLMWFRGFGICVYTHTLYDVHYYLTHP